MARNTADVRKRLQQAALQLYRDQGFDQTTTAQIAGRAGVTERTFFRHFADKREVLFDGEGTLRSLLTSGVADAPVALGLLDTMLHAFRSIDRLLAENRSFAEPRQRVIAVTPALQERELAKIAFLADGLTAALEKRGIARQAAALSAKVGMAALTQATTGWLLDPSLAYTAHLDAAFAELRALSSASAAPSI